MAKKRAKVEAATKTQKAFVAISGRLCLPGTVRLNAGDVWKYLMHGSMLRDPRTKEEVKDAGYSVVPCTITYHTPKRKAKR